MKDVDVNSSRDHRRVRRGRGNPNDLLQWRHCTPTTPTTIRGLCLFAASSYFLGSLILLESVQAWSRIASHWTKRSSRPIVIATPQQFTPCFLPRTCTTCFASSRRPIPQDDRSNSNKQYRPSSSSASARPRDSVTTKQSQRDMRRFIDQPMATTVGDWRPPSVSTSSPTAPSSSSSSSSAGLYSDYNSGAIMDMVFDIVRVADGRKAENIVVLRVHPISTLTSFLIFVSGNSRPQNQAIVATIQKHIQAQYDVRPGSTGVPEGSPESGWMVLDYGSIMVHIMTPKSRLFYNIEGQWKAKGATMVDVSQALIIPNNTITSDMIPEIEDTAGEPWTSNVENNDSLEKEIDPFWS